MTIDREMLRRLHRRPINGWECAGCGEIQYPCLTIMLLDELEAVEATAERRRALLEECTQLRALGSQYTTCIECRYEAAPGRPLHAPDCGLAAELVEKEMP